MSDDFLGQMGTASAARLAQAQRAEPLAALRSRALDTPVAARLSVHAAGFDVIAEIKRRSPALGALADANDSPVPVHAQIAERAAGYAAAGACAISVLTEPSRFDGSLDHLRAAADAAAPFDVPVMRKDFLLDPYQLYEARAAGAGGALLITRMLSDAQLGEMLDVARELALFVLVEAFDENDLARSNAQIARMPQPPLVGLNSRDLTTLAIDTTRLERLAGFFDPRSLAVAESGLHDAADAARFARLGYRLALIGTALMQAPSPGVLLAEVLAAGRAAAAARDPA